MRKLKANHSFDNNSKNINLINLNFSEDEKTINNSSINKLLINPKSTKTKLNSSKDNSTRNIYGRALKVVPSQLYIKNNLISEKLANSKELKDLNNKDINIINNPKINSSYKEKNKTPNKIMDLNIKKSDIQFNESDYIDKSLENWEEVKHNYIQHKQNEKILKRIENDQLNKKFFNKHRKYYFGRQKIYNLPYVYDISSTYMNNYDNRSEHKRHEVLIDELCKLRAYLTKYPNNNDIDIIKDFLIKNNIKNIDKYTNYQLLQLGKFVCQEDIYKINSLLKPYLHVKDMIYDILENSTSLNNKFSGYKFNASIDKLLNKIFAEKNNENNKNYNYSSNIAEKMNQNRTNSFVNIKNSNINNKKTNSTKNNKKFYISELDYSTNNNESIINSINSINNMNNQNNVINENGEEEEKCEEVKTKNHKEFIMYSKKRKELLDSIGIFVKKRSYENYEKKDLYSSPLLKKNKNYKNYRMKNNSIKLPKINNKVTSYYKPNKLLLAPDKDYSSHFNLLLKDTSNELKDFENSYKKKLDIIGRRNLSQNNSNILDYHNKRMNNNIKQLYHSQSCKRFDNNDIDKMKQLEAINRLYYGKKTIKVELNDIQKKNKLTEYIALANAKKHVKDEIINDNVIK